MAYVWVVCARCGFHRVLAAVGRVTGACPRCGDRDVEAIELPRAA